MNSQFKVKFLQHLSNKKGKEGFTLIELLVVVIIIGVLAAIALPNLLSQVAKGRQAEAKTNLGALNRVQQAYRLEKAIFASDLGKLPIKMDSGQYYNITLVGGDKLGANHLAEAKNQYTDDIRDYTSAVGQQDNGTFSAIVCEQTTNPTDDNISAANKGTAAAAATCGSNSEAVN